MKRGLCLLGVLSVISLLHAQDSPHTTPLINANTANLPAQRIGPNDLIAVSVYGSPELTRTVRVGADGDIRLPMVKQAIKAQGRMPGELEKECAEALTGEQLIVNPLVTVTVVEYQSRPISVMGAVRKPVTFQAAEPVTLIEALARAEGLSAEAGHEILITFKLPGQNPATAPLRRIPVKELLSGADSSFNVTLTGGEEVRVPDGGKIFVVGNVKKPGAFGVGGENGATILRAVAMAEGLLPYASNQAVIYRREAGGSVTEIPVELKKLMDRKAPDPLLAANDVLYIPDAKTRRMAWTTVERLLTFGSGATTTLIYGAVVH